jgi:hypothetical protein
MDLTHIRIFALQMCAAYEEARSRLRSWWDRIFFVNERHVGAKFALCRRFFIKIAIRFFAPPLQTATAALGCGLVFGANLTAASFLAPHPKLDKTRV